MIFLRHPRPQAPAGLCYGRMDIDIGTKGEADILRALCQTPKVTRVVASPALRCRKLAETMLDERGRMLPRHAAFERELQAGWLADIASGEGSDEEAIGA